MSTAFVQRALALAAAALLTGVFGVALSQAGRGPVDAGLPQPAVGAWGGWSAALAGVGPSAPRGGRPSGCGWLVTLRMQGVLHPTLPCGARIFVQYGGRQALTQVVAHTPVGEGRELDLTPRLARRLHLNGVREVRWSFSR